MKTSLPQTYNHQLTDTLSYPMVLVKPGVYRMGSERGNASFWESPEHLVHITTSFYIGVFQITQDIWELVMGSNPSFFQGARRPVEQVSWLDIVDHNSSINNKNTFLNQLNRLYPSIDREKFRLPTEAEWEYAAKGGHTTSLSSKGFEHLKSLELYSLFVGGNVLKEVGWYKDNSGKESKEVGLKQSNKLGIYDMSGNVCEWCSDWYSEQYYQHCFNDGMVQNPHGPNIGYTRIIRGGGWNGYPQICRTEFRADLAPNIRDKNVGFRLVLPQS